METSPTLSPRHPTRPPPPAPRRIRVVVVEDQAMVRAGLCSLLAQEPEIEVCGSAATGAAACELALQTQPDVVVADFFLGGGEEGAHLIESLLSLKPRPPRVLSVSLHDEFTVGERAVRAGARGFLNKDRSPAQLLEAVRKLAAGGLFLSDELLALVLDVHPAPVRFKIPLTELSDRELQVFYQLGVGQSIEAIAHRLGISPRTVSTHRENIKHKLSVGDSERLSVLAKQWIQAAPHP